jgi:hypothetical protein
VRTRCKSPNKCAYDARLVAVENAEVLMLDALHGEPATVIAVLTTATVASDQRRFYRSREQVLKALKRRWPRVEYAAHVEYTTGYGPRSGGERRPHWNLWFKGIPAGDVDEARAIIVRVWCAREQANAAAQVVEAVRTPVAWLKYVAMHFQKEDQSPPAGWKGQRFLHSRGFLWTDTPSAREEARASLREKRARWRALRQGLGPHDVELVVHQALELAANTTWRYVADPESDDRRRAREAREPLRRSRTASRGREAEGGELCEPPAARPPMTACARTRAADDRALEREALQLYGNLVRAGP